MLHRLTCRRLKEQQTIPFLLFVLVHERFRHFIATFLEDTCLLDALQGVETLHAVRLNISGRELLDDVQVLALQRQATLQTVHARRLLNQLLTQTLAVSRQDITYRRIDDEYGE